MGSEWALICVAGGAHHTEWGGILGPSVQQDIFGGSAEVAEPHCRGGELAFKGPLEVSLINLSTYSTHHFLIHSYFTTSRNIIIYLFVACVSSCIAFHVPHCVCHSLVIVPSVPGITQTFCEVICLSLNVPFQWWFTCR